MAGPDFDEFYNAHFDEVARGVAVAAGDRALAATVTQGAFAKALRRWRHVGQMDRPVGWVYLEAITDLRAHPGARDSQPSHQTAPAEPGTVTTQVDLREAIASLPPRERHAVVLRYLADLPVADVAEAMHSKEPATATALEATVRTLPVAPATDGGAQQLRDALRTLADEQAPFDSDLASLQEPSRTRVRAVWIAIAAVATLVILVVVISLVAGNDDDSSNAASAKEVALNELERVDFVVVPASSGVRKDLDKLAVVEKFAPLPEDWLPTRPGSVHNAACALLDEEGLAIQTRPGTAAEEIEGEIGEPVFDLFPHDLEVFMNTEAPEGMTRAVEDAVAGTAGVTGSTFIDRDDAYKEFTAKYADDKDLLANTERADLPESFRIRVTPGTPLPALQSEFGNLQGVDTVVVAGQLTGEGYNWRVGSANPRDCRS